MWPLLLPRASWAIPTYGVMMTLAFLLGALWMMSRLDDLELEPGTFWLLGYCILPAIFLGAKLGFLLVEWRGFLADPSLYLTYWRSGWVYWTGPLSACLAIWAFFKVYNRSHRPRALAPIFDHFAVVLPLGHALGRLGCFANGCCYGRPTSLPWGVRFTDPLSEVPPELLGVPLHPTQLYEAAGELSLFALLFFVVFPRVRSGRHPWGTCSFTYLGLYSLLRFLIELLRGDDRGVLLWSALSPAQWISLSVLAFVAWRLRRGAAAPSRRGGGLYLAAKGPSL